MKNKTTAPTNVSFELLELLAAEHAPAGGSVLFRTGRSNRDLRLVRHGGEPITTDYCYALVMEDRDLEVVGKLPPAIEVVFRPDGAATLHLERTDELRIKEAVVSSMNRDAVDL